MALIKCPECGREISDTADHCVHCGYPMKKAVNENQEAQNLTVESQAVGKSPQSKGKLIAILMVAALVIGVIGGVAFTRSGSAKKALERKIEADIREDIEIIEAAYNKDYDTYMVSFEYANGGEDIAMIDQANGTIGYYSVFQTLSNQYKEKGTKEATQEYLDYFENKFDYMLYCNALLEGMEDAGFEIVK